MSSFTRVLLVAVAVVLGAVLHTMYNVNTTGKVVRVMTETDKQVYFKRLSGKVFIGTPGNRPFIISTNTHVWNGDTGMWVRY